MAERKPQIVVLPFEPCEQHLQLGAEQSRLSVFCQPEIIFGVSAADLVYLAAHVELLLGILAEHFLQTVPNRAGLLVNQDQGFVHKLSERVQHILAAHGLGRFERPTAGDEHREPPGRPAFGVRE